MHYQLLFDYCRYSNKKLHDRAFLSEAKTIFSDIAACCTDQKLEFDLSCFHNLAPSQISRHETLVKFISI